MPVQAEPVQPVEADAAKPMAIESPEPSPAEATPSAPRAVAQRIEPAESARVARVVETSIVRSREAAPVERVRPETVVARAPEETLPAEDGAEKPVPVPEPKPVREPAEPKRQADAKPAKAAALERRTKPEKPVKPRVAKNDDADGDKPAKSASGAGGRDRADARKGVAEGRPDGKRSAKNTGAARQSTAGNAAVSNYPGKVASKLRRAFRAPAEAKRKKLTGEVRVAFVVSASGAVGSVRVVRSSGSPILDRAAVEAVHRAAPFPAIPAGAGRSNWPFTVPLAFSR
jgi:periplasmic protein TonB